MEFHINNLHTYHQIVFLIVCYFNFCPNEFLKFTTWFQNNIIQPTKSLRLIY